MKVRKISQMEKCDICSQFSEHYFVGVHAGKPLVVCDACTRKYPESYDREEYDEECRRADEYSAGMPEFEDGITYEEMMRITDDPVGDLRRFEPVSGKSELLGLR